MPPYSDAELHELPAIDKLVREAVQQMGLKPANHKSFDELIASGEWQAAECLVQSKELVTPEWLEKAIPDS